MTTQTVTNVRVRLSFMMAVGIVLSVAVGVVLIESFENASRSIGWIVFSGVIALLLYPALNILDRFLPRGLAVLSLVLFVVVMLALPAYTVVDNVNRQSRNLERTLPQRALELETHGRFAESFKEFELSSKVRDGIKRVPEILQGGTREEQIKANADRALAFVAGGVLMLFFLFYGNKLVHGALSVITDKEKHQEVSDMLYRAYARCTRFSWSQIGLSIAAGLTTYGVCRLADIPAAGLFGVWVALWNLVPVFGVVIGSVPIVLLAGAQSVSRAVAILIFFIVYEICESLARHRLLGPHALRLDSIITILVVFGGIELYGLGGALAGLVIASFVHALLGEIVATHPK